MVVKVYGAVKRVSPQRVLACLIEKEIDFEFIPIDLDAGDHKKPDFLLRQPFGKVPAIEDGDFKLFESRAIIRYYAAKYAERGAKLLGKSLEERAVVEQWMDVEGMVLNELVYAYLFQVVLLPRMGKPGDAALAKSSEEKLEKVLDVYEERLSKSTYLAGDSFTLADLTHLPVIKKLMNDGVTARLATGRKSLNAWWEVISSRPAWKKVMDLAHLN